MKQDLGVEDEQLFSEGQQPIQPENGLPSYQNPPSATGQTAVFQQQHSTVTSATLPSGGSGAAKEESEPMKEWRLKREAEIAEKDKQAQAKHTETLAKAKKDLENFIAEYNEKKQKSVKVNRFKFPVHLFVGSLKVNLLKLEMQNRKATFGRKLLIKSILLLRPLPRRKQKLRLSIQRRIHSSSNRLKLTRRKMLVA
jgi:hypothetical protein